MSKIEASSLVLGSQFNWAVLAVKKNLYLTWRWLNITGAISQVSDIAVTFVHGSKIRKEPAAALY